MVVRIGVDVGGTFTDLVMVDEAGSVSAYKAPSVPSDPAQGVLGAIALAASANDMSPRAFLEQCGLFVHGSTVATNAVLERKGCKVGLLATKGFRDTLEIRRGIRPDAWDHRTPYPKTIVPRRLRRTVGGRLDKDGNQLVELDMGDVAREVELLRAAGVEAVAIAFLHSYRNPEHEYAVRDYIRESWPECWVSCSADIAPIAGEYERTSTVVLNAYLTPLVAPYLNKLDEALRNLGLKSGLLMIQSNGGAISFREIAERPAQLVLSGPAAGIGALQYYAMDAGSANLAAIEVGGTSCDVTFMNDNKVVMADSIDVGGYHVSIPTVDIHTVGAGGGTIAWVDQGGLLHAGPEGAGARPGPASYDIGGDLPTVTDAQLVLGRLKPGPFAGGIIRLNKEKAVSAIRTHVAEPLGLTVEEAAVGIIRLVNQNIVHAVEHVVIERGVSPRTVTLIAAGGAGALHASAVAQQLRCSTVFIPRLAGVFCAFGMCNTPVRHDHVSACIGDFETIMGNGEADNKLARLADAGAAGLAREGFAESDVTITKSIGLRYPGQQWTIQVTYRSGDIAAVREEFEAAYEALYGYRLPQMNIQVVDVRASAFGRLTSVVPPQDKRGSNQVEASERRLVWIDSNTKTVDTPVFDGARLRPGDRISGPAIIEEATTTILIGRGDSLIVSGWNNYRIDVAGSEISSATDRAKELVQ